MKEEIFNKIVEEIENLSDGKYIRAKWISQCLPSTSVQSVGRALSKLPLVHRYNERVWIKGPSLTGAH